MHICRKRNERESIYVSTIIDSHNYGTVLQAFATAKMLSNYGMPYFVDYRRSNWSFRSAFQERMRSGNGFFIKRFIHTCASMALVWMRRRRVFRRFLKKNLTLCSPKPFLRGQGPFELDATYVVGSDQVWNYECNNGIDPVFYFKFLPNGCRRIALSASFGREHLNRSEIEPSQILLEKFEAISVREKTGIEILESLGIFNAIALKDPVLSCKSSYWTSLAKRARMPEKPYVLVYMLNECERMLQYARNLAKEKSIDVKLVTFSPYKQTPQGFINVCLPSPEEWVALFKHCNYVVTDSFHGTCFSIIFERPMTIFEPPKYSIRLTDVLADFKLSNRYVSRNGFTEIEGIALQTIDWVAIRRVKKQAEREAELFLDACFSRSRIKPCS